MFFPILSLGEYYIQETKVEGYNDPAYAFERDESIHIKTSGDDADKALKGEYVINALNSGVELPHTGGPGNEMIKLLGATIMLTSIAVFLKKKRK